MGRKDYVPRNDDALLRWAQKLINYTGSGMSTNWKIPPANDWIGDKTLAFERWLVIVREVNHGKVDVVNKNTAKAELEKACREYVQGFIARNKLVTDGDREEMGLPIYDKTPTNIPAPQIQVGAELRGPGKGLVELNGIHPVGDNADSRSGYGVRIYYGILGEASERDKFRISAPPKTGDDLPHSVFTRRKKYLFDFSGESGKQVFFCMRYENSKGQAGPWGSVLETFIS